MQHFIRRSEGSIFPRTLEEQGPLPRSEAFPDSSSGKVPGTWNGYLVPLCSMVPRALAVTRDNFVILAGREFVRSGPMKGR